MSLGVLTLLSFAAFTASLATVTDKAVKVEPEPRYDVATVIDVDATVIDTRVVPQSSPLSGVHLSVKIESETIDVYLGPVEFLKDFDITFAKGDKIELIGSKVKFDGARIVLARQVRRDETTLYLRDAKGKPHWKAE
ncbi:MAG TPA: hypothetical protein VMT32_09770 [Bryobacteraceae bacterium]|nr:hypothetical protein [Bryobacteraceae bacterium]